MQNNYEGAIEKFVLITLGVLFTAVALYFNTFTQNIVLNKQIILTALAMLLFFIWIGHSIYNTDKFRMPSVPVVLPIVMIVVIFVISTFFTPYFWYYNIEETSRFLSFFAIILTLIAYCKTVRCVEYYLIMILFVTLLTCLYGILQIYNVDFIKWGIEPAPYVSTFGNQNFFGGYLVVAAPICLAILFTTKNIALRLLSLLTYILCGWCILYSGNRSAMIGFAFENVFFIILSIRFGVLRFLLKKKRLFFGFSIISIILAIALFYVAYKTSPYFAMRMNTIFQTTESTNLVRKKMWTGAGRMLRDAPILGQGQGTFQLTFPRYRPSNYHRSGVSHNTMHAHNEFMEWFAELGLLGITHFAWLFVAYFIFVMHMLINVKSQYFRNLQIPLFVSTIGFIVENLMSVNYRWIGPATQHWFVFGLSVALCYAVKSAEPNISIKKKAVNTNTLTPLKIILFIVLIIVFFYFIKFCYKLAQSDFYLKMGMVRVDNSPNSPQVLNEAEVYLSRSILLYPYDLSSYYKLGFVYLQKGTNDLRAGKNAEGIKNLHKALEMYNEIIKMAPNYAQIHNNIGMLYLQLGNYYEAMRQFEWATILENNERNHENLIHYYMQRKFTGFAFYHAFMLKEVAREEKERAVQRLQSSYFFGELLRLSPEMIKQNAERYTNDYNTQKQRYINSIKDISTIRAEKGNLKSAVNWITLAIDLEPQDVRNKLIMMSYLIRTKDINYVKRYFDYLNKTYSKSAISHQLFNEMIPLLNSMMADVQNNNESKAKLLLCISKSYKIIGNNTNAKLLGEEARKLVPTNNEIAEFLKNI